MSTLRRLVRNHAKPLVALVLMGVLYAGTRVPALPSAERAELASRFGFRSSSLPVLPGLPLRSVRPVHPSLSDISAWISSVGAAVALNDIDGDGLPNDLCHVDPRIDRAIVGPVPGDRARFQPFGLDPAPLPYDPATMAPMGCLPGDVNEDGLLDLVVYYWGRTPIAFLRHQAGGTRSLDAGSYVPREVTYPVERWYTNAATLADLDGDGHLDLVVGNYFQDGARILDATAGGLEQMQHSMSRARNSGRHHLLLWERASAGAEPTVRFVEPPGILAGELALGWTLAVGAADLDGDLLPELYFANDFGPDQLLHNRSRPGALRFVPLHGRKTPTVPSSKVLGRDSFKGMGVDFADLNGDGWLDLYVSNIAAEYALEESHFVFVSTGDPGRMAHGIAPYVDRSEALGLSRSDWSWDVKFGDFDNDGVLEAIQATGFVKGVVNRWPELQELAMGNDELLRDPRVWPRVRPGDELSGRAHNPFFVRARDGRYYDLAPDLGLDHPDVTRGIATADVDGDGALEFAIANQWEPSTFYHNEGVPDATFLGLYLVLPLEGRQGGVKATAGHPPPGAPVRAAIGATAVVTLPDGRRLSAHVDGGNGHSGKRSHQLHFGLGRVPDGLRLPVDLAWRDQAGRVRHHTLQLPPGWHTVLLDSPPDTED